MGDKNLEQMIDNFLSYCEGKNYRGVIAASDKNYQQNYAGNYADNFDVTFLLRNILRNFQEKTGTPATVLATHVALSMAIMDISDANKTPLEKVDEKILKQAINVVKECMDKELEQTRANESKG